MNKRALQLIALGFWVGIGFECASQIIWFWFDIVKDLLGIALG